MIVMPIHRNNGTFPNKNKMKPAKITSKTTTINTNESKIISGNESFISARICQHPYISQIEIIITNRNE